MACDEDPAPVRAEAEAPATGPSELEAAPTKEPQPQPESRPEPEPEPEPAPFDPLTAMEFQARIVDLYEHAGWAPCGILHSVGAIEVEVLGHGDPGPHMVLFVSCPADMLSAVKLEVGEVLQVSLHAKAQTWPKPPRVYRDDLPFRYVKRLENETTPLD